MRLHKLKIKGFRRLKDVEVLFGNATFLIGQNNVGKSSILKAIELLLSANKRVDSAEYYSVIDEETGETKPDTNTIILEAEFRNLPEEANTWRGFKGRIFNYEMVDNNETGLSITYRKTYNLGEDVIFELKSKERVLKTEFIDCKTPQNYIDAGLSQDLIEEHFPELEKNIGKSVAALSKLEDIDDIWDITEDDIWFKNPGGIPGNVLKMLPRFLLIPVDSSANEISDTKNGVLGQTLNELFDTVRENSLNFKTAQEHLDKLSKELDPGDTESEFGKMMSELNEVLSSVFPDTKLYASTDLSDASKVIKPAFNIEMSSNVKTPVNNQGTGSVRAAAFGMLRFRQKWIAKQGGETRRSLIICFEEPEIYLHPSAANQMRNTIYELSSSTSQIVASTHSPYMIDISRKPLQMLNRLSEKDGCIFAESYSITENFKLLQENDKDYIKMLLKVDDYVARAFFTKHVVIVEGDTEEVLIKESMSRLPKEMYLNWISSFEIIKARGKAAIISLIKYLTSMGVSLIVIHDRDQGIEGAEKFNKPISEALGEKGKIVLMKENVEDELGYTANSEKPFKAYQETKKWGDDWNDLPENWRNKLREIFGEYVPE